MINERFDLITAGDIGLHDGVMAERPLSSEDLEPVEATRPRTSLAPCRASSRAVASPRPLLAPVMTTTLSSIPCDMAAGMFAQDEDDGDHVARETLEGKRQVLLLKIARLRQWLVGRPAETGGGWG